MLSKNDIQQCISPKTIFVTARDRIKENLLTAKISQYYYCTHICIYEVILYSHQFECVACVHGHPGGNVAGIDHSPMTNTDNGWIYVETGKNLATLLQFFLCGS